MDYKIQGFSIFFMLLLSFGCRDIENGKTPQQGSSKQVSEVYVHKNETCVEYTDGNGAMIITNYILTFSKDSVQYSIEDEKSTEIKYSKSFKYIRKHNNIQVEDTEDDHIAGEITILRIAGDTLFGNEKLFIKKN